MSSRCAASYGHSSTSRWPVGLFACPIERHQWDPSSAAAKNQTRRSCGANHRCRTIARAFVDDNPALERRGELIERQAATEGHECPARGHDLADRQAFGMVMLRRLTATSPRTGNRSAECLASVWPQKRSRSVPSVRLSHPSRSPLTQICHKKNSSVAAPAGSIW